MVKWHVGDLFAFCFGALILLIGSNALSSPDLLRYGIAMLLAYLIGRANGSHH